MTSLIWPENMNAVGYWLYDLAEHENVKILFEKETEQEYKSEGKKSFYGIQKKVFDV
jgi:hypothetical protein